MTGETNQRLSRTVVQLLAVLIFVACTSTDEQYQYENYEDFSTQSADLSDDQSLNQGANQYNTQGYDENNSATQEYSGETNNTSVDDVYGQYINNAEPELDEKNFANELATDNLNADSLFGENTTVPIPNQVIEENRAPLNSELLGSETNQADGENVSFDKYAIDPLTEAQSNNRAEVIIAQDIIPSYATLWWVGYNYQKDEKKLYIEIVTRGEPEYKLFQEVNQAQQPELVLRLLSTRLRPKLHRDLDASEFRSPVAYLRMRQDDVEGHTDIVITLREASKPKFFAKDGNFLFTYNLSEQYFTKGISNAPTKDTDVAEVVGGKDLVPNFETGSDLPKQQAKVQPVTKVEEGQVLDNLPIVDGASEQAIPDPAELPGSFVNEASVGQAAVSAGNYAQPDVVSTVIPDETTPGAGELVSQRNVVENESTAALPEVAAPREMPVQPVPPAPGYYPPSYARPYAQPYQNRYQPNRPAYGQPAYPTYPATSPTQDTAEPIESQEVEGSGFDDDNSLQDFEGEDDEDDISKFEVRHEKVKIYFYQHQHVMAVAQYDPATEEYLSNFSVAGPAEGASTNYGSGDYDYGAETSTAAEITDLTGSADENPVETYNGKLISIEFHNASITNVLKAFTDQTGINFVYPSALSALSVSVKLVDVPWDAALKAVLDANNLAMTRVTDTIVKIDQNARIVQYLTSQNALARAQAATLPTKTLVFRLSYANAQTLQGPLSQLLQDPTQILPNPRVSADQRTNSIVVEAIPQVLAKAKAIIQRMDTPNLQAEIAARIVEVSKSAQNFLGVQWGGDVNYDAGRGLGFGSLNFPNSITSRFSIDAGRTNPTSGDFNFRFGSINGLVDLDLRLQMEEQLNNSETLQSQKIIVRDGDNATIISGKTDRFQEAVVVGQVNAQGTQAGGLIEVNNDVNLTINNLQISNDEMVTLPLVITSDSDAPTGGGSVSSSFRREIRTTLVSRSGETVVIGGAYSTTKNSGYRGVPILSKIPIIGALFRQKASVEDSKELLVMLTPNILSPSREGTQQIDALSPASTPTNYENGSPANGSNYGEQYTNEAGSLNEYSANAANYSDTQSYNANNEASDNANNQNSEYNYDTEGADEGDGYDF